MRRALSALALLALALAGCGGRVEVDGAPGSGVGGGAAGGASSGGADGAGGFAPHPECAAAEGTRICGGASCPWLEPPDCLGYGCTPALTRDALAPSDGGVCWADLPGAGAELCYGCPEGQLCIHRTAEQLVCVPAGVCEALWDLGVRDVCRYTDKSPYDHQPIPSAGSECPGDAGYPLCGGGCPSCGDGRCNGRSPSRPFGICARPSDPGDNQVSSPIRFCSPDGKTPNERACWAHDWACAVFDPSGLDPIARRYGTCLGIESCLRVAKHLPGGLSCFDSEGKRLTP